MKSVQVHYYDNFICHNENDISDESEMEEDNQMSQMETETQYNQTMVFDQNKRIAPQKVIELIQRKLEQNYPGKEITNITKAFHLYRAGLIEECKQTFELS